MSVNSLSLPSQADDDSRDERPVEDEETRGDRILHELLDGSRLPRNVDEYDILIEHLNHGRKEHRNGQGQGVAGVHGRGPGDGERQPRHLP
jgi:hypothetical protein